MPPKKKRERESVKATSKRETRSATKPKRDADKAAKAARLRAEADALALRRRQALANRAVAPAGSLGDGALHLAFIRVGQGDCTVVGTPGGQVIVFDCGSDSREGEDAGDFTVRLQAILSGPKFLATRDTIDILVLTHPDSDHYNQLELVLTDTYQIDSCYHSALPAHYAVAQTSAYITGRLSHPTGYKKVVHNHDAAGGVAGAVTLNGVAVAAASGGVTVDRLDGAGGIRIVDEPNCKVAILAADVNHLYAADNSNPSNRGSLVTLIEANGAKVLICGDGTVNTERYLLNTVAARISNVNIVQAGHHGSINTSSSQAFVDRVNPRTVVASAGKRIPMHHLPSEEVITRYVTRLTTSARAQVAEHETFFYAPTVSGAYVGDSLFTTYPVYTTGSRDTLHITIPAP